MPSASSACLFVLLASFAGPALCGESIRLLVQNAPLAGLRYYDADEVAHALRVGDALELAREGDNPHDSNAIAVHWRGRKLGYLPKRDNAAVAWALDRGAPLGARVSRLARAPRPARRIEVEVYLE